MPYSITTKDGITIENIPDDVDPNDQSLKDRVAELRGGEPAAKPEPAAPEASPEEASAGDEITRQLGLTLRAGVEGAGSILGIFSDPIAAALNEALPEDQQLTYANETVSNLLTKMGVPEPASKAERIVQEASQALVGGGGTIAAAKQVASRAAAPVTQAVSELLAAAPGQQLAGAALSGAAGQATEEAGGGEAAQLAASLAGGVTGAGLAGLRQAPREVEAARQVAAEAEKQGIRTLTSDIAPPRTFAGKWLQSTGEKIPLAGTGSAREAQQVERIDAVKNVLRDFGADDAAQASDRVMADLAKKRSGDLKKYTSLKSDVIDGLSDKGAVPVNKAVAEIDNQIAAMESLRTAEVVPAINRLNDFKQSIQGQGLRNVEELRKQLGESFKAPELAAVRTTGDKAVNKIYGALREDMGDFIATVGDKRDFNKWSVANNRLSAMAGEMKNRTLKSTLARGDATPEVINSMLFSQKPSDMRTLYKGLTPKGRESARMAVMARAAEKAGGIENVSPDRFANELKRLSKSVGVFFKDEELDRVQGLVRALNVTKRASEAAASPATGVQLAIPVGAAVLTDILGGAGAATATGATVGFAARAYESAPVRNMLLKINKTIAGSEEEAALVKRLLALPQLKAEQEQQQ
jgi:hypothetical protein